MLTVEILPVFILVLVISLISAQPGPGVSCICLEPISSGNLSNPISIQNAQDGSGRLFIAEQRGYIWIMQNGERLEEPFLDITNSENFSVTYNNGIQTFAFHPDVTNNGLVYVYFTTMVDLDPVSVIAEFSLDATNPNKLNPDSERRVMSIRCPYGRDCHYGGLFLFGPDGYLYIGHGDGVCCADDDNNGQNRSNYLGAVHRIDVDSRTGGLEYGIPSDNPFLGDPLTVPEMYAYGVRQPFKGSMDSGDRITGDGYGRIFFGDVGSSLREEINMLKYGANYGWSAYEGDVCKKPEQCELLDPGDFEWPLTSLNRTDAFCVISGSVYRGCMNPGLDAWFLFADLETGLFFGLYEDGVNWVRETIDLCGSCPDGTVNTIEPYIITLGQDQQGEHYVSTTVHPSYDNNAGAVYRIVAPDNQQPPCPL